MDSGETEGRRLREPPSERFSGAEHVFDLAQESARLRSEAHPSIGGHRQIVLVREGPVSLILFDLEPGSSLPNHAADGIVTIEVLSGRAEVTTETGTRTLTPGGLLVLRGGVAHDVAAPVDTQLLVGVHLSGGQ